MAAPDNLLRQQTSPYLLQHADNPVHWRPWGADALAEARATNRPILLSVGYAACHWCHVMAHESFEDPETAAVMNALYVNIKVDREERPDIDHLYMSALHALGEQGGWPLTMFLTPDGDPFWGGTYFPPEPRWGRPSFRQVLHGVADAYHAQNEAIQKNVGALRRTLAAASAARPGAMIGPEALDRAAATLLLLNDPVHGGLRGAPKFPNASIFRFLWQNAFRSGMQPGQDAVHLLLQRMSQGGIYDHLGGGYARYATDAEWLVPHFEKMLYDNAQLLELLALAHAHSPDPLYAARAAETVGWLVRNMRAQAIGGLSAFAASEDADSEGEEGKFYVWTEAEVDAQLGPDAPAFKAAYDVTAAGNWEGHTILRRVTPPGDAAAEERLARARAVLRTARETRVRPGWDDKVLADWNGLAIAALARAASVFGHGDWLQLAAGAFDFIHAHMSTGDGRIQHAWRLGHVTAAGMLDDQAAMARAALALHEATGDVVRLDQARAIVEAAETWFADAGASYFTTASDAADVPFGAEGRPRTPADNATPSGNGLMAEVLARLYHLTGETRWRDRAEAALTAFSGLGDSLSAAPTLLAAADLLEDGATVVVTGAPNAPATQALLAAALAAPDPAVTVLRAGTPDAVPSTHPAYGKATGGQAAAYLCRGGVCGLPLTDPAELTRRLQARAPVLSPLG
ncbi:thioredoxin domain-containing protein [Limobrevibacterium gyesilva]|uniref:Thioredoxin domain-containing protein n=1 Tax=Limobrevibacterium gyesilva TaxID=2991712 RepID=A0AA41YJV9_9PROT|nr:thioredoxin domain-containing protein [Limobrevibacterium gyesilva]MCW3473651.1 thioredoxin domain-containing protein [Limobrevibacterium gyesilva]